MNFKGKYAIISGNTITIYNEFQGYELGSMLVKIEFMDKDEIGILTITGKKQLRDFVFGKAYLNEEEVASVMDRSIKYGYKNLMDRFTDEKTPYVHGWFHLVKTKPFKSIMKTWTIFDKTIKS